MVMTIRLPDFLSFIQVTIQLLDKKYDIEVPDIKVPDIEVPEKNDIEVPATLRSQALYTLGIWIPN